MPRHVASNHPHCYIDCPNGGWAYYNEDTYQCMRDCHNAALGRVMADTVRQHGWDVRTSATVGEISGLELADLARMLRTVAATNAAATAVLDDLEALGTELQEHAVDVAWSNLDGVDALRSLRNAAAGPVAFP